MRTDEIRLSFLEFFKAKGHTLVASDSLVPKDDPTLLFTGAGMNQFKEKFLGRNITYRRATTSQKCLRTGDLDNVGRTTGHHTFFEMLGNFSFGDYFKKEAIGWSWEFFTKELKIDPDRLWASVYKDDEEAYRIWADIIKMPERRIMRFGERDNFWPSEAPSKGPNGPCGPCSEIFYDYGKDVGCGKDSCDPSCNCGRFVEVWNMVFTQYDRQQDGTLKPLPSKNIDTGMGLERLASVMQGVKTNFEIDIFLPITGEISSLCRSRGQDRHVKAIADHIRAVTFCIADGVMPSNEERGYVVRKLIRRSLTHANELGLREPFLYRIVGAVAGVMGHAYPDLVSKRDDIAAIVKREEENFLSVIALQIPKVEEAFAAVSREKDTAKLSEAAFNFYDTYGMPYDMLEELAEKHSLKIDKKAFEKLLEAQRAKSRAKTKIKSEIFTETFARKVQALGLRTEFLGYEDISAEAKVAAVLGEGEVILDRTPFYGESGGQAGDWGTIETPAGAMEVEDAKKIGETIVHVGRVLRGRIVPGEKAKAAIDAGFRLKVAKNHTATHLLQAALIKVLGPHVHQTGSMVDGEHLRFDFTHMKKMEDREIARVEELVNSAIKAAIPVVKRIEDLATARKEGAMALFGEKYEDRVRVVAIGDVSKELCGGTHAVNTKDIGVFKITSESSVASGIRRIEAVTGEAALKWASERLERENLKIKAEKDKEEAKRLMAGKVSCAASGVEAMISKSRVIGGIRIVIGDIEGVNVEGLRSISDRIRAKEKDVVSLLTTVTDGKVSFIISVSEGAFAKGLAAGALAKELASLLGGSGGGRELFAQGGGKDPSKLPAAVKGLIEKLEKILS